MTESKGIGSRILGLDRRIIGTIALIVMIWPLVTPIGMPIVINKYTKLTYDLVESYPDGSVAVFECSFDTGYLGSIAPGVTAFLTHLMEKRFKIVAYSLHIEGPMTFWISWDRVRKELRDQYEYGVDFVYLGFMTGGEAAQLKFGEDIKGLYTYDYEGTPLDELPLLDEINNHEDFDLVFFASRGGEHMGHTMRVYAETFGVTLVSARQMAEVPVNFIDAGLLHGYVRGLRGGSEYELLLDRPGRAVAAMDATSLFFSWLMIAVIIGNIGYFLRKREAEIR